MSNQEASNSGKNSARRKLLKGIVAGGGTLTAGKALPESWTRPVVESVVLPAHAQTTDNDPTVRQRSPFQSPGGNTQPFVMESALDNGERFAASPVDDAEPDWDTLSDNEILDFFAAPAHAGEVVINASSFYYMEAAANSSDALLCIEGRINEYNFYASLDTTANDDTIFGGTANSLNSDASYVSDVEFSDFSLVGDLLRGSFTVYFMNASSSTQVVDVRLEEGGTGCTFTR